MEEKKKTHIATTCKLEKIKTPSGDELVVCIPVEVAEGVLGAERKFIDTDGTEFLPAYDAFLKGEKIGYILDISFEEILNRGKKVLVETMGYEYAEDEIKDEDLIIQNYKEEYVTELEDLTWYYILNEVITVLSCDDNESFFEMYNISIDRNLGAISTKAPRKLLTGKAYANFRKAIGSNPELESIPQEDDDDKKNKVEESKVKITRLGLIENTKKYVIAQDEALPIIASAIYNPIALNAPKLIQNIMLYGPTGVGKTYILETIAKKLDLPYFYASIADFSSTGYVGSSVNDLYIGLYNAAGRSKEKLEKGAILFLDEVDKLILDESNSSDIKSQVYSELLPIYQHGGVVSFKAGEFGSTIKYNKEKLIVVSGGSFARMDKLNKHKIGFSESKVNNEKIKYYTKKDFEKFGVPVEWLGRQDLCVPLAALSEEDLYRILTESLESPYLVTTEVLKLNGITLNIPEGALRQMAHKAYLLQTGARSLRGIFEFALQDELNHIVDKIDSGTLTEGTCEVSEEAVVKKLEKYYG